jgi:hypothetical protein
MTTLRNGETGQSRMIGLNQKGTALRWLTAIEQPRKVGKCHALPTPILNSARRIVQVYGSHITKSWNGVTVGMLLHMVDSASRCQPMHPTERLSKKLTPLGKPEDMLTWTRLYRR